MSARDGSAAPSVVVIDLGIGRSRGAHEQHRRLGGLERAQEIERLAELGRPRLGGGIVEGDHEVALGGGLQAALDRAPGLEIVRQRDGAEVAAQRRADLGRSGQHGGDAGLDPDVELSPLRIAILDRLEHRRRHGEHAGITARDDDDLAARGGERQSVPRAVELDAIVGGMAALAGTLRHAVEIGTVAHEIGGVGECRRGRRRHELGLARTGADHHQREPVTAASLRPGSAPWRNRRRRRRSRPAAGCARPSSCRARHRRRATAGPPPRRHGAPSRGCGRPS